MASAEPDWEEGIAVGDCLAILPTLRAGSVDLVLTSPPYNLGKPFEPRRTVEEYVAWCQGWLHEIIRVVAPTGSVWLNLGYLNAGAAGRCVPIAYLLWPYLTPLHLVQQVIWTQPNGPTAKRRLSPRHETLLWLVRDPRSYTFNLDAIRDPDVLYPHSKRNGRSRVNPLGKNPSDVWPIRRVQAGRPSPERTDHPAQMPLELARRIVLASTNAGDLCLDPLSGVGTSLVAGRELGRRAIGIEQRADYAAIARDRLRNVIHASTSTPRPDTFR
jgi:adenine-specific DNA-methyltransferase